MMQVPLDVCVGPFGPPRPSGSFQCLDTPGGEPRCGSPDPHLPTSPRISRPRCGVQMRKIHSVGVFRLDLAPAAVSEIRRIIVYQQLGYSSGCRRPTLLLRAPHPTTSTATPPPPRSLAAAFAAVALSRSSAWPYLPISPHISPYLGSLSSPYLPISPHISAHSRHHAPTA